MDLERSRESSNIEDRRGMGGGGRMGGPVRMGGIGGIGAIILILVGLFFGIDPRTLLGSLEVQQPASSPAGAPARSDDEARVFVAKILGETEDTWKEIFRQNGAQYQQPPLVLFSGAVASACGQASAATGPFYCPGDRKVYLDTDFFHEMATRFRASGDFAYAYVVAHEVGHHVQNLLGIMDRVDQMRSRMSQADANALSVKLELQADCFAGVWANHADKTHKILQDGDIDEGLRAANAIGDDRLQKQAQGYVVPDSFTHGTSAQRVRWFKQGLTTGDIRQCDTFNATAHSLNATPSIGRPLNSGTCPRRGRRGPSARAPRPAATCPRTAPRRRRRRSAWRCPSPGRARGRCGPCRPPRRPAAAP